MTPRHVPGEAGLWVLLFGDLLVFTVLFSVYLSQRGRSPELFATSQDHLNRTLGAINTVVLLTSSVFVVAAMHALRTESLRYLASWLTVGGLAMGICFVIVKAIEYREMLASGITPKVNEYYMWYYSLTGLHLTHVVLGLIVLCVLSRVPIRPRITSTHIAIFEGGGCFWHMVDALWLMIFPLLFLVH